MSEATFRTMRSLLHSSGGREEQTLIVPDYQRGYKWAVKELLSAGGVEANSALETLLSNLDGAFCESKDSDYFLQGVTVRESADGLVLIDGQQRVTSFYLILWCLGGPDAIRPIRLQYDVRAASQRFLDELRDRQPGEFLPQLAGDEAEGKAEDEQDVYYFKQALRQIHSWWGKRPEEELKRLADWLLDRVRVIYLTVDTPEKAVRTFTMMNGAKATMLAEELAKAEALRRLATEGEPVEEEDEGDLGGVPTLDDCFDEIRQWAATQWETAARRGRCAREWDRWLYWWNRPDVQRFFNVQTPWGWLLDYALWDWSEGKTDRFSFEAFRSAFMRFLSDAQDCFERLRSIQTAVEDVYADPIAADEIIAHELLERGCEYVVMAGYMRMVHTPLLAAFPNRVVNLHPALLPSFTGAHAIDDAFARGVKVTGVTVHFANEIYDNGPIIAQRALAVEEGWDVDTLEEHIHAIEHVLYPEVVQMLADGRVHVLESGKVAIDAPRG